MDDVDDTLPHPDCRAPHRAPYEYVGPTHACAGHSVCTDPAHKAILDAYRTYAEGHIGAIPEKDLHDPEGRKP